MPDDYRQKSIEERKAALRQEHDALTTQLSYALDAADRLRIQRHLQDIERQLEQLERGIYTPLTPPIPGSAPAPPSLLIGREGDLRQLKARLAPGPQPLQVLTAIRGWPGVGKTSLAAALAHDPDILDAFPDGILWTSLGPRPNLLAELIAWGRALGADLTQVTSLAQASAQLTALLRGKRTLLIIDDVWQAEHAAPFKIGGPGCAILVTTRGHDVARALAPTPDQVYCLPVLNDEQALELLRALAPTVVAEHSAGCLDLARCLDGLPLALQVAGHLLQAEAGYGFGVEELLADLRQGARLLEAQAPADRTDLATQTTPTIAALLETSTDRLDERARGCFACLSAFPPKPNSFDLQAVAAVCQVEEVQPVARQLVDRGLLEPLGGGRFQVHALLAAQAAALLPEAERGPAHLRHAAHYQAVLSVANYLYEQGGEDILAGLALFDQEWPNIQAGQAWAAANAASDEGAAWLGSGYPDTGAYVLNLRLHAREWIRWLEAGLAAAGGLGDRSMEGAHLGNLGLAYDALGDYPRAIELYQQALVIMQEIGDKRAEGQILGNLGNAYRNLGDYPRAIEHHQQALAISREIGDRRGEGADLGNLGNAYKNLGDYSRAIEHHQQALAISREIGDRRGEGQDLGGLGLAYAALGETQRAIEHYEQWLEIARQIGDRRGEGQALGNLGNAYYSLGDYPRAIEHHRQALAISREIGDRRGEGADLGNLGLAYAALGDYPRAIELYQGQLEIARQIGDRRGEGQTLGNLGNAYRNLGDYPHAIEHHQGHLEIARQIGDRRGEGQALGNLGIAYYAQGDRERAITHMQAALEIFTAIGFPHVETFRQVLDEWRGE